MSTENNSAAAVPASTPLLPPSLPETTTAMDEEHIPTPPRLSISTPRISQGQRRPRPPRSYWRPPPPPPHLFDVYRRPPPQYNSYQWNHGHQLPQRPPFFNQHHASQGRPYNPLPSVVQRPPYPDMPMNGNYHHGQRPPVSSPPPPVTFSSPIRSPPASPQPSHHGQTEIVDIAELRREICNQVEYYFGTENFPTDAYLRRHMVDGWADVYLVAGFRNMKMLTSDIDLILESLQASQVVEVQGNKMRPRWI